jgi:hypothetical protein
MVNRDVLTSRVTLRNWPLTGEVRVSAQLKAKLSRGETVLGQMVLEFTGRPG